MATSISAPDYGHEKDVSSASWGDELGRLRVWAANIGAHQTGQSSLDFRLRDASHISNQTTKLLQDLDQSLKDVFEELSVDGTKLSEDDEEPASWPGEESPTELQQLFGEVVNIIDCSRTRDKFEFEFYDKEHVRNFHPKTEEQLGQRLGRAITRRRKYLFYRERHHRKLEKGIEEVQGIQRPTAESVVSETIATDFNAPNIDFEETSSNSGISQISYAPSLVDGGRVTIPPPPKESVGGKPFECPFCFFVIDIKSTRSWNRHVFKDIKPYVCTFFDCSMPDRLYDSRREWYFHEKTEHHRDELVCSLCKDTLNSPKQYERHVARHLEELALFALSRTEMDDAEDADAGESGARASSNEDVDAAVSESLSDDSSVEGGEKNADPNTLVFSRRDSQPRLSTSGVPSGIALERKKYGEGLLESHSIHGELEEEERERRAQSKSQEELLLEEAMKTSGVDKMLKGGEKKTFPFTDAFNERTREMYQVEADSDDEDSIMEDVGNVVDTPQANASESQLASEESTRASNPSEDHAEDVPPEIYTVEPSGRSDIADDVTMKDLGVKKSPPAGTADEVGNLKVVSWPSGTVIDPGSSPWKARQAGYDEESIDKILRREEKKLISESNKEMIRPTYIKVYRKHMSPETLDEYQLPWEWDKDDSNYLIVKKWIPENEQNVLFEHTKKLREEKRISDWISDSAADFRREKENLILGRKGGQAPRTDEVEEPSGSDYQSSDQEIVPPDSTASYKPKQGAISAALDKVAPLKQQPNLADTEQQSSITMFLKSLDMGTDPQKQKENTNQKAKKEVLIDQQQQDVRETNVDALGRYGLPTPEGLSDMKASASRISRAAAAVAAAKANKKHQATAQEAKVAPAEKDKPIKFIDPIGRKFNIPFEAVRTWPEMEHVIKEAFIRVSELVLRVNEGQYDLVGPQDEFLSPYNWASMIKSGWEVTMRMWPNPERPPSWEYAREKAMRQQSDNLVIEKEEEDEEEEESYIFVPERKQRLLNEPYLSPQVERLVMQETAEPTRKQEREKTPLAKSQSLPRRHSLENVIENPAPYTPELSDSQPTEEAKQPNPRGHDSRPPEPTVKPVDDVETEGGLRTRQTMTEEFTLRSRPARQEAEEALRMQEEIRQGRSAPLFNVQKRSPEAEAPRSNEAEEPSDEADEQTVPIPFRKEAPFGPYHHYRGSRKS